MAEPFDPWQAMRDAASRLHDDPDTLRNLTVFIDFWGMDCYTPPAAVEKNVRDLVQVFAYAAKTGAPYAAGYVPASEVQRAREEALEEAAHVCDDDDRSLAHSGQYTLWAARQDALNDAARRTAPSPPRPQSPPPPEASMTTEVERIARDALAWAIQETPLRLPPSLRHPDGWQWDGDDLSFRRLTDDGEFRFHVAGVRRGARRARIAVMSVNDDGGSATWEADVPAAALRAQENRDEG